MPKSALAEQIGEAFDLVPEFDSATFSRAAFDASTAALMTVNTDYEITYLNPATIKLMAEHRELFAQEFPRAKLDQLIGQSIDVFHKNPAHQRRMLAQALPEPHDAEIAIGELRFKLRISSVLTDQREFVGHLLEWADVSEARKQEAMLAAIDRAQAVIEFSLNGQIQQANANFITTMGYSLEEISGRHHSMFVDPAFERSVQSNDGLGTSKDQGPVGLKHGCDVFECPRLCCGVEVDQHVSAQDQIEPAEHRRAFQQIVLTKLDHRANFRDDPKRFALA